MPKNRNQKTPSQLAPQNPAPALNPSCPPESAESGGIQRKIKKSGLTFSQQSALTILAYSPTIAQAARSSGIGESTLRHWINHDPLFRQELARLRQESSDLARQELHGLMLRSVSVFSEAMSHPDIAIRLRAARYALSFALRISENEKLSADIQALEEALALSTGRQSPQ